MSQYKRQLIRTTITIDLPLYKQITEHARKHDLDVSKVVRLALRVFLHGENIKLITDN